jgi:hypothetical protein
MSHFIYVKALPNSGVRVINWVSNLVDIWGFPEMKDFVPIVLSIRQQWYVGDEFRVFCECKKYSQARDSYLGIMH